MPLSPPTDLQDDDALFLDFDGTLAAIHNNPAEVWISNELIAGLEKLSRRLNGAMAVISGRDIRDLAARTPEFLTRIGGHGLEVCKPFEQPAAATQRAPSDLTAAMKDAVHAHPGAFVEEKHPILAVHYRAAPAAGAALLAAVEAAVAEVDGYKVQHGKMVVEAKPIDADKGRALIRAMGAAPFAGRAPVMVGDDVTDEDAFAAAQRLGGRAIKVGSGDTRATARLEDVEATVQWIARQANL